MRNSSRKLGSFPLLCLLVAGCASSGSAVPPPGTPDVSASTDAAAVPSSTPARLYARDGSVIGGDTAADSTGAEASTQSSVADRQLGPSEGGRMYILELYQKAIDERDALELEVRSVQSELERARTAASRAETESSGGAQRIAVLEAENRRLLAENVELAARLTTAQIRRLQAEKLLLEARIGELRTAAAPTSTMNDTQPVASSSKP